MGKVIMSGIVPLLTKPSTGILASSLAVGSVVKLRENGTAVEYLVVNQGKPSGSSLYDDSCDGTWLLRKDCHSKRVWNSNNLSEYADSTINTWLNGDFFNSFGNAEQVAIKRVKIPYCVGGGSSTENSGANGLSAKVFLLSGYEVGWTSSDNQYFPQDGAKLSYFESGTGTSANNKRVANYNGSAAYWWLRSPDTSSTNYACLVRSVGDCSSRHASYSYGIRPALVLPSNALFDKTTMLLKGVA